MSGNTVAEDVGNVLVSHGFPVSHSIAKLIVKLADACDKIKLNKAPGQSILEAALAKEDIEILESEIMCVLQSLSQEKNDSSMAGTVDKETSPSEHPLTPPEPPLNVMEASGNPSHDQQLDNDYTSARFCSDTAALERIQASAASDNPLAKAYLSVLLDRGCFILKKNAEQAVVLAEQVLPWLQEKAQLGNLHAQYNLGLCFGDRRGVKKDEKKAFRLHSLAADQGHANAQRTVGYCFDKGEGTEADLVEAVRYYKLSADQGNVVAQCNLGLCCEYGAGVSVDMALKYYKLAAKKGLAIAQNNLGWCYQNGRGVIIDKKEAARYYRLAADQGNAVAQCNLGVCYYRGIGVMIDKQEAVGYYKLSANQGCAGAQCNLGVCYEYGKGVSANMEEALKYYKLAADQGHADALSFMNRWQNYKFIGGGLR